jgi:hypothetical protein
MAKNDKGRLAPFVPMLKDTINSKAWKALTFGARALYMALKARVPAQRNVAYLSINNAAEDLGYRSRGKISEWFKRALRVHRSRRSRQPRNRRQGQGPTMEAYRARRQGQRADADQGVPLLGRCSIRAQSQDYRS